MTASTSSTCEKPRSGEIFSQDRDTDLAGASRPYRIGPGHRGEELPETRLVLKLAKIRGVGARYVEHHVVGVDGDA